MRHRFHALCPYFAMFPESFAEHWLNKLTRKGDVVLDPFCGRGTLPFQALLMNRSAVACDVNDVACCITRAKTHAPRLSDIRRRVSYLRNRFNPDTEDRERRRLGEFFRVAYSVGTLRQLLYLRRTLDWRRSHVDCMIAALVLGALHGESERSPSFLSNQMPHTISTKPEYSVRFWQSRGLQAPKRDAFDLIDRLAAYRYETPPPSGVAQVFHLDMRDLPRAKLPDNIRCAITSPPYFNVTSYEEDQWLRLWFLGGSERPRATRTEERTGNADRYWRLITDMWRVLGLVLRRRAHVVVRIGAVRYDTDRLVQQLLGAAVASGRKIELVSQAVSAIQKRQTESFRPGSTGCGVEVDCHFAMT